MLFDQTKQGIRINILFTESGKKVYSLNRRKSTKNSSFDQFLLPMDDDQFLLSMAYNIIKAGRKKLKLMLPLLSSYLQEKKNSPSSLELFPESKSAISKTKLKHII